jgi:maleylacetate reductase
VLPEARMHVAHRARALATELGADGCVSVGGGSAIGLGKAIALEHGLPVIAVPTTYAGSEMTPIWGLTDRGAKRTGRDPRVLPASVLYDPDLTLTLPGGLSATSGMNAIAHAVEGLYAPDASPIISLMAEEGIRALATALPRVVADGADIDARADAQYGAWLCGAVLGATTIPTHPGPPSSALPSPGRCTTSSATPSAAPWTSPTPRRTPSSCPTPWPTTPRPPRRPSPPSPAPSAEPPTPPASCGTSPAGSARPGPCASSA